VRNPNSVVTMRTLVSSTIVLGAGSILIAYACVPFPAIEGGFIINVFLVKEVAGVNG